MRKYKLAIVDDDEDERFFIQDAFNVFPGFEIVGEFGNGDQLLGWLEGPPAVMPELILSDLNMPGKNGYDVICDVQTLFPHIPVIITSTSTLNTIREKCMALGAYSFLVKPDVFIDYAAYAEKLYSMISAHH